MTDSRLLTKHDVKKVTLLVNPSAGKGTAPGIAERAIKRFLERGVEVDAIQGRDAEEASILAKKALAEPDIDAFAVVGGDGILSIALQAAAGSNIPFGQIPSGTGNDGCRTHGIPLDSPEQAADVIADGFTETIDLGKASRADGSEKWFHTIVCSGFDSLVNEKTNELAWPKGRARYFLAIVIEVLRLKPLHYKITIDGADPVEQDITAIALGNTKSYGGGMHVCPHADHTDGLLDITVLKASGRIGLLPYMMRLYKGNFDELHTVQEYRAKTVTIESQGITAFADGEFVTHLPCTISIVPQALHFLVPQHRADH